MNSKELKMVMLMVLAFEWMFHETACASNKKQKQIKIKKQTNLKKNETVNDEGEFFLTEYLWKSELLFY